MINAKEWAESLYRAGADMTAVNKELAAAMIAPNPTLAASVRNEFTKLVMSNMEIAKRSKTQYANWKGSN